MAPDKVKIVPENITMFHLDIARFEIKEVAPPNTEDFNLNLSHKVMHNLKDERVKIALSILLNDETGNEAVLDIDFHFHIKELSSFYNLDDKGTPVFSGLLIITLLGIGFSTARGILYERFANTIFNRVLLPIISPQKMLEKKDSL